MQTQMHELGRDTDRLLSWSLTTLGGGDGSHAQSKRLTISSSFSMPVGIGLTPRAMGAHSETSGSSSAKYTLMGRLASRFRARNESFDVVAILVYSHDVTAVRDEMRHSAVNGDDSVCVDAHSPPAGACIDGRVL